MTSDKSLTRARREVILRVNCNIAAGKTGQKDISGISDGLMDIWISIDGVRRIGEKMTKL